jgi:hypothetical protein
MNYDRELNKGMKVFSQLYVGLKPQSKDSVDLGFATPFEKGSAFEKRKKTVDEWCGTRDYVYDDKGNIKRDKNGCYQTVERPPKIKMVDNKPRGGFKITDDVKRVYWGGGNVVWRVEDPEGFELEIQSQNLMAIIQTAGVNEGGVIPGYCLWGRDGKNNILLHEKSEEYKNAILAAETLKKPGEVSASVRKMGTKYLLQDGSEGIYLGKFWVCTDDSNTEDEATYQADSPVGGLVQKYTRAIGLPVQFDAVIIGGMVRLYKKAPLVREIEASTVLTPVTASKVLEGADSVGFASATMKGRISYIHYEKPVELQYTLKKINPARFQEKLENLKNRNEHYFRADDKQSAASFHSFYGGYGANAAVLGLLVGGSLYGNPLTTRTHSRGNNYGLMFPMQIISRVLIEYRGDDYRFGQSHYYSTGVFQQGAAHVKAYELPKFGTPAELAQWYQEQYDAGNLVEIVVEAIN